MSVFAGDGDSCKVTHYHLKAMGQHGTLVHRGQESGIGNLQDPETPSTSNQPGRRGSKTLQQQKQTPWSSPSSAFDQAISILTPLRYFCSLTSFQCRLSSFKYHTGGAGLSKQARHGCAWHHMSFLLHPLSTAFSCRELISPVVRGTENLPSASQTNRPLLFVGNHARIGLYDMPYLMSELYLRGVKVILSHCFPPGNSRLPLKNPSKNLAEPFIQGKKYGI